MENQPTDNPTGLATAGFILGIVAMLAWCIPLFGLPVTIVGVVLSVKGMSSSRRGLAIAGLVLNIVGLAFTLINAAVGAYLGATGQLWWQKRQ
jgi:hypothetical protein